MVHQVRFEVAADEPLVLDLQEFSDVVPHRVQQADSRCPLADAWRGWLCGELIRALRCRLKRVLPKLVDITSAVQNQLPMEVPIEARSVCEQTFS